MILVKSKKDTKSSLNDLAREYLDVSSKIKELESLKKHLAEQLKQGAENVGVKDDRGSFYVETESALVGKVAKKSIKLNQEKAIKLLREKDLENLIDEVTVYEVNESKLESAIQNGDVSRSELESITDTKVTYAVVVKEVEEAKEIEQSEFKKVARRK